jgi:aryl-alcohol dehydrogenase-like predicted oxidoreductase
MPLSLAGRPDEATALAVFKAALDAGVDFFDTANSYCKDDKDVGHNERLIAHCLRTLGATERVHVATKGGLIRPRGAWHVDARPERLHAACEQSLRDLGVAQIFLYQLHAPDPRVPFADSVGALAELQRAGKIRHVGLSNVSAAQLAEAQAICRVESVQNRCNPTDADDLRNGVLEACARQRVSYIAYSPVGGGYGHAALARKRVLVELARAYDASPYQVLLAWLLGKGAHILPIPGASKVHSIVDSAAATRLTLRPEDTTRVDALGR